KQKLEVELRRTAEERARVEAAQRGKQQQVATVQKKRLEHLIQLASTERVREVRSRWLAMIPFGVGQYQNGHNELGMLFAVSEATLLAASIVSFALHESLRGENPTDAERGNARLAEAAFRYTNQITLGLFAAVTLAGIIDAQVRFAPTRTFTRP